MKTASEYAAVATKANRQKEIQEVKELEQELDQASINGKRVIRKYNLLESTKEKLTMAGFEVKSGHIDPEKGMLTTITF